jgi:hypothetical protein
MSRFIADVQPDGKVLFATRYAFAITRRWPDTISPHE